MKIQLYQPLDIHEIGQRKNQEDSIFPIHGKATKEDRLFIVCDGMGGHEKGEVASQTICQSLSYYFLMHVSSDEMLQDDTFKAALEYAYHELDKKDDGAFRKMGTTLTFLYFHRGGVTAAHIGDSRIYHVRPGKGLLYVSRDHSLVFDLYQSGEISYEEMKTSPQKNIITRALQPGEDNRVRADIIYITDIEPNDYFYMCSDGMLEQMEDEELASLLSKGWSDEKKRQQLIASTIDNKDNHSAYLIHVESVTHEQMDRSLVNGEPTARCNALNIHPSNEVSSVVAQEDDSEDMVPDVVSVEESPNEREKKFPMIGVFILAVIGILFLFAHSFCGGDKKEKITETIELTDVSTVQPIQRVERTSRQKGSLNTRKSKEKSPKETTMETTKESEKAIEDRAGEKQRDSSKEDKNDQVMKEELQDNVIQENTPQKKSVSQVLLDISKKTQSNEQHNNH